MLRGISLSHCGKVRERNEDSYASNNDLGVWCVADGVGGNAHGDVASQLAVQSLEQALRQGMTLIEAISKSNDTILQAIAEHPEYESMATTIVASHFEGQSFELAWVGDSRAYLLDQAGICQLTTDHNLANQLLEEGEIERSELGAHSGRHELTQALGQMSLDDIPSHRGTLNEGDYLLLCTDGLSGVVSDEDLYRAVMTASDLESAANALLTLALDAGAPDNITLTLIHSSHEQMAENEAGDYRSPFDRAPYIVHSRNRPILLLLIFVSILLLMFLG